MSLPKDRRMLLSLAEHVGWTVDKTNGGHVRVTNPQTGQTIITSSTPSDFRATLNFRAELKKAGLREPEKSDKQSTTDTTEYFTMPDKQPQTKTKNVMNIIREILAKYSRPLEADEFWPQVAAKLPEGYSRDKFMKSLYNAKNQGTLIQQQGKWSIPNNNHRAGAHIEPVLPTNEDQIALLDALKALEALKAIVERYQRIDMTREGMQAAARAELLEKLK